MFNSGRVFYPLHDQYLVADVRKDFLGTVLAAISGGVHPRNSGSGAVNSGYPSKLV